MNFEQKESEKTIRENQVWLSGIVESAVDAIITVDKNQTILLFNKAAEKMFLCPAEKAIGQSLNLFIPQRFHKDHSKHIRTFGQTDVSNRDMAAGRVVYGLRFNGKEFPAEASISQVEFNGQKFFTVIMRDVTERIRNQEAYFKLASIVESSNDAIISKDFNGIILSWNKAAEHIFGYTAEEALGQNISILFPTELLDKEQKALARIRSGEQLRHYETTRKRKDGSEVELFLTISPIKNKAGEIIGVSKIARDITDQKRTERDLRESNQNFQALVKATTQAVWEADEFGQSSGIADWWQDLTGQNLAEMGEWGWLEALHPDDRQEALSAWTYALLNKTLFEVTYRVKNQNGQYEHFAVRGVPVFNEAGSFRKWIGTFTNISKRKQSEEKLIKSEERYRLLFDSNPLPLVIYNFDNLKITDANEAACHLYGYTRQELLTLTLYDFGSESDINSIIEKVKNNSNSLTYYGLWKQRKKDGTEIFVETTSHKLEIKGENSRLVLINDVTQRTLAEIELRQWADAFENCAHGIAIGKSKTNHILACNPAFAKMCGKSIEEIVGFPILSVYDPSVHEEVKNLIATADRIGKVQYESVIRRKDGTVFQSQMDVVSVPNEAGEIIYRVATMQDISERKKAEQALRESEGKLSLFVEYAPAAVAMFDREMNYLAVSQRWLQDYQLTENVIGRNHYEVIPEITDHWKSLHQRCLSGEIIKSDEEPFLRLNGSIEWLKWEVHPWYDSTGKIGGITIFSEDITERKVAEEQLFESEARYRLLFESNPHPMWVYDPETLSFLEVNDAATHTYGYSRDEFLSMTIKDIRPQGEIPALLEQLSKDLSKYQTTEIWQHQKKDGTVFEVEVTAHEFIFNDKPTRLILAQDVTEKRNLEEQLRQSQKMDAIGQLAGGVAHDFNNMLTAINGYSQLILKQLQTDDPLRGRIEEINKAGLRAATLTRQLLIFSRKQVLQPKVFSLNAIILELEKMLRRLIGENIEFRTILDPHLGSVKADPGQIEQVIMNLVVNARDAMPQGGKLVIETQNLYLNEDYVRQHLTVSSGNYIMLAVSDNGIGMDPETQTRIFEPFFTTKESGKGTGLGLSTVYGIVKQSEGSIWVYSELGRGTTFKVYLPCVEEVPQDNKIKDVEIGTTGTETILLVEDEEVVRNLTREILETYGYNVLEASNGGSAILICEKHKANIQLLITDIVMPEINGPELAKRLSKIHPEMKVLYMSGYTDNAIFNQGIFNKEIDFIQKPFAPDGLCRKVREILDKH